MNKAKKLFDKWSITYNKYLNTSPFYQELVHHLVEKSNLQKGMTILDIGVGTGLISKKILKKVDCQLVGIDFSSNMLLETRRNLKKYKSNIELYKMDVCKLKFKKNSFDGAFAAFALHHVPDKEKRTCLKKVFDVLKPSGVLNMAEVVVDVEGNTENPTRLRHILERWGYAALLALQHGGVKNAVVELDAIKDIYLRNGEFLITPKEWQKVLKATGFKKIQTVKINPQLGHYIFRATKER